MSEKKDIKIKEELIQDNDNKQNNEQKIDNIYLEKYNNKIQYLDKFEKKIVNSIYIERLKSSNIDDKTLLNIYTLLEDFQSLNASYVSNISKLALNNRKISFSNYNNDSNDEKDLVTKLKNIEGINQQLSKDNFTYKNEIEILKKENKGLKDEIQDLNTKYIELNQTINKKSENLKLMTTEIEKLKAELSKSTSQVQKSNKIIEELKSKIKNYEGKIKLSLQKTQSDLKFLNYYHNNENKIEFIYLLKSKQLNQIFEYLSPEDLMNYRLSCKEVNKILINEKTKVMKNFYLNIIKRKNEIINKINKYDIKMNYLTKLPQLEQLIKIYSLEGKKSGLSLKASIDNALFFLNRVVKVQLGISESKKKSNNSQNYLNETPKEENSSTYDSFFGGFKSIFGFGSETKSTNNPKPNNNMNNIRNNQSNNNQLNKTPGYKSGTNSKNSSFISKDTNKIDFEQNDEILLKEINSTDYGLKSIYEFDFLSPDDINLYLNKFLKSPFPVDKLTDFITKLCNNFCALLFNSYTTIKEIHQIEIVLKCLNERFKYYYDLNKKNQKLIKDLYNEKNNSQINMSEKKKVVKKLEFKNGKTIDDMDNINISGIQKVEEDNSFEELEKKYDLIQMNLNISNKKSEIYEAKYEEIKNYFEQYKEMTKEKNNELQFQIDLITQEKKELEDKINNLKNYISKLSKVN